MANGHEDNTVLYIGGAVVVGVAAYLLWWKPAQVAKAAAAAQPAGQSATLTLAAQSGQQQVTGAWHPSNRGGYASGPPHVAGAGAGSGIGSIVGAAAPSWPQTGGNVGWHWQGRGPGGGFGEMPTGSDPWAAQRRAGFRRGQGR